VAAIVCLGVVQSHATTAYATTLPCQIDGALEEAAAEVLSSDGPVDPEELVAIVRRAGGGVPSVRGLRLVAENGVLISEWIRQTEQDLEAPIVCGVARDDAGILILAGARQGSLRIDMRPELWVRAQLEDSVHSPHLVVRDGLGEMLRISLDEEGLDQGVGLPPHLRSPIRVQLMAVGSRGPLPVAERVVLLAEGQDESFADERASERSVTTGQAGPRWVDAVRAQRGASPARNNRLLRAVAQAHAVDVCASGRVGHELVPGADPEVRLRRNGVRARVVGEVVARASDRDATRQALLRSPSHHLTLVDSRFTDVGYGEATNAQEQTCTVVLLAAWPRVVPR